MRLFVALVMLVGIAEAKPQLNLATEVEKAPGATVVKTHGGGTGYVKLGTSVEAKGVEVVSTVNDNSVFQLRVKMASQVPKGVWPVVGEGGTWWRAESHGGSGTEGDASFTLGRVDAMTLAKAYGVSLRERTKLDDGLVYTWTIAKTATTKKSAKISVKLRVQNTSKAPIGFLVGGMFNERGDDRFVPEIELGGTSVPLKQVYGANGGMQYQKIAPGKSIEVTTDLRGYPESGFAKAGTYSVKLRYEGEVAAPDDETKVWEVAPQTTATIVVK